MTVWKFIWIVFAWTLLSASAGADVVYLRNGKTYEGKAVRCGEKVRIKLPHGVIEVDAADVVHIEKKVLPARPASRPSERSAAGKAGRFTVAGATRPEPIVFMFMRNLAATPAGTASYELRRQIERWQAVAHDRKRKVGGDWLSPEDFQRHRLAYAKYLKEAQDLARRLKRIRGDEPADLAERRRLRGKLNVQCYQAAKTWADPLLRNFLLAAAYVQSGDAARAEANFRQCISEAPHVAGFHQGHALALQQLDRHADALAAAMRVLELRPDSREALNLLRDAMQKVSGAEIRGDTYAAALKLLAQYEDTRRPARRGQVWLMPGADWLVRDETLPEMPYDRLVFTQALGVPVGKRTLLVDAALTAGAAELFVRIDEKTVVPGFVRRAGSFGRGKNRPPLALVSVEGYEFTPLETGSKKAPLKFTAGQDVKIYGLGFYKEMGRAVREVPAKVEQVGPAGAVVRLSACLGAGEAAGPVVTPDGKLAGFCTGKTQPIAAGGGPDKFIGPDRIAELVRRVRKSSARYGGYRRAKRTPGPPRPVAGTVFVVCATAGELLEKYMPRSLASSSARQYSTAFAGDNIPSGR